MHDAGPILSRPNRVYSGASGRRGRGSWTLGLGPSPQGAQDAVEDASVAEVLALVGCVDAHPRLEGDLVAAIAVGGDGDGLGIAVLQVGYVEGLLASQPQ